MVRMDAWAGRLLHRLFWKKRTIVKVEENPDGRFFESERTVSEFSRFENAGCRLVEAWLALVAFLFIPFFCVSLFLILYAFLWAA